MWQFLNLVHFLHTKHLVCVCVCVFWVCELSMCCNIYIYAPRAQ